MPYAKDTSSKNNWQDWPSGLGNELIIRPRQVQLLYPASCSYRI